MLRFIESTVYVPRMSVFTAVYRPSEIAEFDWIPLRSTILPLSTQLI